MIYNGKLIKMTEYIRNTLVFLFPYTKLKMHIFNENQILVYFLLWIYQICTNHFQIYVEKLPDI